jgi:NADPH:quinone reductase-like Zn-dependent oxidoreductase
MGFFGASTISGLGDQNIFSKLLGLILFFFSLPRWSPLDLMNKNRGVFGLDLNKMWDDDRLNDMLQEMANGYETGWVRPHVDSVFEFEQIHEAHQYIEHRKNIGKVILVPTKEAQLEWKK